MVRYNILLLQSGAMSSESPGCEHDCSRNGDQSKILKGKLETRKVKMHYKFLTRNKEISGYAIEVLDYFTA